MSLNTDINHLYPIFTNTSRASGQAASRAGHWHVYCQIANSELMRA